MSKGYSFTFTADEAEILIDALDADLEGYEESVRDARGNGNRGDVATFTEAADRIRAVRAKIRAVVGDDE
ncbi:MAG: hypothetical protein B7Z20_02810 [Sphingobium sp. 32-64-5]|nr:MAG: hypothetical protein B7Z20_02810 [Sphingobium sp. 32-64-5]